jgi:hypothetical protein
MAGRPPSEKTFANMLRVAIKDAHVTGGDKLRAVAEALVNKAISGDVQAIREVADRLDGKVPQAVDASVSGNITVQLVRFGDDDPAPE